MRVKRTVEVVMAAAVCAVVAGSARAEDKKPGMFDFMGWKSPVAREREAAGQLAPVGLDLTPAVPSGGEPRTIRVRVYADSDYRGLIMKWQARLRGQLGRVNAVVGPVFHAQFEIESLRSWDRSHVGASLDAILNEIEALDPGREVDLVLALVTPARGVETSLHRLGEAGAPGRHIVLRGMDDEQEGAAIDREYHLLSDDERGKLYSDRKAHKEVVLFLHEWGHTAGLLHEEDHAMIMNPFYDPRQTGFGPFDKQVLALVIDKRLAPHAQAFPESGELLKLYEAAPADVGSDKARADVKAFLRQASLRPGRAGESPGTAVGLSHADVDAYNAAVTAARSGHPDEAWNTLAPLVARLRAGKASAEAWTGVARLATAIGALTVAEEAIGHVPRGGAEIEKIAADVEMLRQRVALPPGPRAGLPPEQEPAYVSAFWATTDAVAAGDLKTARARQSALAEAHPDAAGVDLLACEIEYSAKHAALAAKRCEAALEKYRFAERAHYLLGIAAARAGRYPVAEQHLEAAIHIDAKDAGAWRTLADVYRAERARGRLDELARRYQEVFSVPMPR
jgi:tetratricopeptide (TPR) repeat protein